MSRDLAGYDPYSAAVRADPYAWYPLLQRQCPVHHFELPRREVEKINENPLVARPTNEFWTVTRREDVVAVLQDARTFINGQGQGPERTEMPDGVGMLVFADEPHHRLQRRLVAYAFTPRTIETMAPHIEAIATRLADDFADRGAADIVEEFVNHLPVTVIATMRAGTPARCVRHRPALVHRRRAGPGDDPDLAAGGAIPAAGPAAGPRPAGPPDRQLLHVGLGPPAGGVGRPVSGRPRVGPA